MVLSLPTLTSTVNQDGKPLNKRAASIGPPCVRVQRLGVSASFGGAMQRGDGGLWPFVVLPLGRNGGLVNHRNRGIFGGKAPNFRSYVPKISPLGVKFLYVIFIDYYNH